MTNLYVTGSIVTDESEQELVTDNHRLAELSGYVSLSNMQNGDIMTLKEYAEINGDYEACYSATYSDVQTDPLIYVTPKEIISSLRVTLQQTLGNARTVRYSFLIEDIGKNGAISSQGGISL